MSEGGSMRIVFLLEAKGGFVFDDRGRPYPTGGATCAMTANGAQVYQANVSSFADLREQLERLADKRDLVDSNGLPRVSEGQTVTARRLEFCLPDRSHLVALPNEEALIEWLDGCRIALYQPGSLAMAMTAPDGRTIKRHFYLYEDGIESVESARYWATTDPTQVAASLGVVAATWQATPLPGVTSAGSYEDVLELDGLFGEAV